MPGAPTTSRAVNHYWFIPPFGLTQEGKDYTVQGFWGAEIAVGDRRRANPRLTEDPSVFLQEIDCEECQLVLWKQAAHALNAILPHERDPFPDFFSADGRRVEARALGAEDNAFSQTGGAEVVLHYATAGSDQCRLTDWLSGSGGTDETPL